MIKKIGVENFRVFKDYTEFEIRPITLLVGPNNSGKSSFTKLLLLLKNGIETLNFEKGNHNLESFDKVINWESDSDNLKLIFKNLVPFLDDSYQIEFSYENRCINKLVIFKNKKEPLLKIEISEEEIYYQHQNLSYYNGIIAEFDIRQLIDVVYNKEIQVRQWHKFGKQIFSYGYISLASLKVDNKITLTEFKNLHTDDPANKLSNMVIDTLKNKAIYNEIENFNKDYLLFKVLKNDVDITASFVDKILSIQQESFKMHSSDLFINIDYDGLFNTFKKSFHWFKREITTNTYKY